MMRREPSPQIGAWVKKIMGRIVLAFAFWLVVAVVAIAWFLAVGGRH